MFPVLAGEVTLSQLTSASSAVGRESSCECGGKRKKECCKEKVSEQVRDHMKVHVSLSDYRTIYITIFCVAS